MLDNALPQHFFASTPGVLVLLDIDTPVGVVKLPPLAIGSEAASHLQGRSDSSGFVRMVKSEDKPEALGRTFKVEVVGVDVRVQEPLLEAVQD